MNILVFLQYTVFKYGRLRPLCVLVLFTAETVFAIDSLSSPASTTVYAYRQTTGSKVDTAYRSFISSANEIIITYEDASPMKSKALCDDHLHIHSWQFESKETGYHITAKRSGDTIAINGTKGNKTIKKSLAIDSLPWYQAMEFSLLSFLKSAAPECEFWMVRPTDMKAFKMIARRKALETVQVDGRSEKAVKVTLSPCGLAGRFWHATYWFRVNDYVFLRNEVPRLPGASPTIIESIETKKP